MNKTHESDRKAEEQQNQSERVTGKIRVKQNADGTHTGKARGQQHTTRRIDWSVLD